MNQPSNLTLAYSPCPNDTFLFYHLVHSNLSNLITIQEELKDVEALNQSARASKYDITKLSFAAFFQLRQNYELLDSGAALGRNCGPLLIRKKGSNTSIHSAKKILSPGAMTTANLLLELYSNKLSKELPISFVRYEEVIPKLMNGEADLGVIIHEERFTYQNFNLELVADLGQWWEDETGYPIPLGCIAIKKSISDDIKKEVDATLKKSLELAWNNPVIPQEYILQNSQNKELSVVQAHIDLYVNQFTKSLKGEGERAITELENKYIALAQR
ncbi:1,4-dihydroxy-6-naphthoate synthase [Leptospira sp. GIMC2001]|uniref:1,4-dihydroxy-6-naphthoate synthase n=1 Tax=Leptospira sp. GIMC2001 TaxID=1513297 RepID=UPI00234A03C1|nr:1,4-dihydroxy-6-naphthoate synthase [Leptospira sp. GIMC2001]WCL47677.1 1,4-dihydroxy-6-naphthoate synthase [Leptospira sp. GIMC2001]